MLRPRRRAAFWWTFAVTLVVTLALGSPWVGDRFERRGNALTAQLISGLRFPGWTLKPVNTAIVVWASPILADIVLALLVGVVAMLVTSSRARIAALLAGWGLLLIAAPVVGVARVFAVSPVTHPGHTLYTLLSDAVTRGLWFGATAGWLVGAVLAFVVRKTPLLQTASEDADATAEPATVQQPARIWTPSQPDWQETSDMPALGAHPRPGQPPQPTQTQMQPTQMQPTQMQAARQPSQAGQPGQPGQVGQPGQPGQVPPWPTPARPPQPGQPLQGQVFQGQQPQGSPQRPPQAPHPGQPTRTQPVQPWGPAPEPETDAGPTRVVPGL